MVLTEVIQSYPRISISIVALFISLIITIINYFVLDKDKLHSIKARQKELQEKMQAYKKAGNSSKMLEIQKEIASSSLEMMKHSMKPMLITFIPIIIFFSWIRSVFVLTSISTTWIWWYLVSSMIGSIVFRKLFRMP